MTGQLPQHDPWQPLRAHTRARIGLARAGDALATREILDLDAAHALARDVVHADFDVDALTRILAGLGLGAPVQVASRARDRAEYLRRPDLGRLPDRIDHLTSGGGIALVVADGLSPGAVTAHAGGLCAALTAELGASRMTAPVIATGARVALGDHIGAALAADVVVVAIGERPGLSVTESVGLYLTWQPRPGRTDAERNCISNIHPPDGLGYRDAARTAADLITQMFALRQSGIAVKARAISPQTTPTQLTRD
jgi:ethanolamine ammonia-lyase small subunit